jgi:membrane-bound acyltransferase YfiQ involved in biofilm formation
MDNTMSKQESSSISHLRAWFIALVIDIVPALIFLHQILSYNDRANNYDVEKAVFLYVIPIFISVNFFLALVLYSILAREAFLWRRSLSVSIGVFLVSYPLLYCSSYLVPLFPLRYPEQELLSMWIFTCSGWLLASACGAAAVFLLNRGREGNRT